MRTAWNSAEQLSAKHQATARRFVIRPAIHQTMHQCAVRRPSPPKRPSPPRPPKRPSRILGCVMWHDDPQKSECPRGRGKRSAKGNRVQRV